MAEKQRSREAYAAAGPRQTHTHTGGAAEPDRERDNI